MGGGFSGVYRNSLRVSIKSDYGVSCTASTADGKEPPGEGEGPRGVEKRVGVIRKIICWKSLGGGEGKGKGKERWGGVWGWEVMGD